MLSLLRKKMKTIMIVVAVLFGASMFYGLGYQGIKGMSTNERKGSIATVNGKEIDHQRFQQSIRNLAAQNKGRTTPDQIMFYQSVALQQVVDFTLMLNEAKRNFRVGRGEMDQAIDQIMQANKIPSLNDLKNALKNMGQTFSQFKQSIKEEILVSKMVSKVRGRATVTPEDLREVKASHILIIAKGADEKSDFDARAQAEQILQKIKKGEDFALLAMRYSEDKGSAKKGGDLGYSTTGMMLPEFEKVIFSLKPGEVSDVFRTYYGYHIARVEDTRLRKVTEKGKDISEIVLAEKQELAFRKWVMELQQKSKIEVNEPLIKAYTYFISGKLNEAISAYNLAINDNPNNAYIHLFLGNAYLKAGNTDYALVEYERAGQFSGADPGLLIAVGDAYKDLKKRTLALEEYRKASLIAGDNKDLHIELKKIFKDMGSNTDAAKEQVEISRIEKKEKFEKEIQEQLK